MDLDAAKHAVANGAPAVSDKKAKEASAQPDDEMEEVVDEPAIFADPFSTDICRFLATVASTNALSCSCFRPSPSPLHSPSPSVTYH